MSRISVDEIVKTIDERQYTIGIVGLGYVGIPLALASCKAHFNVVGFDIDVERVNQLNRGESFIRHIPTIAIDAAVQEKRFVATTDFDRLAEVDAIIIAVPTPLSKQREPDLSFVSSTAETISTRLRPGQLIVLESTTWPGTTDEVLKPILERSGLKSGLDFFIAFSPEREDPGNLSFSTANIPKVIGGDGPDATRLAKSLYDALVVSTVRVSSTKTAEAVKITENVFRAVNIALVNELKIIFNKMGIDVWEVIEAAKTKPFGYMPFYPGPGLGGHCIPIDPFYLTWKAREYDVSTQFIELAGQINTAMPYYVVDRLANALDKKFGIGLNGAKILMIGISYKKNIDDVRESPALKLMELLRERKATLDYHDPFVGTVPMTREHGDLAGLNSVPLETGAIGSYTAVLIATDHDNVDYRLISHCARLVIDTRNICARLGISGDHIVTA